MIPMLLLLPVVSRYLWTKLFLLSIILHSWKCRFPFTANVVVAESVYFRSNRNEEDEDIVTLQKYPNANIVGGTPVTSNIDSGLYSSFAIPKFGILFCGSILIWTDVLLSAAHCEGGYNSTTQKVIIGGTTLNGTDAIETNVSVRKAIIHPDYTVASINNEVENDIMLVFLQRTTNSVIPLAKFNTDPKVPPDNAVVTVIGHGISSRTTNELTYQLNALNMTTVNFFTCDNYYDVLNENVHLCATGTATAMAPCEGDSGGPLFYHDSANNQIIVVGVVSFGFCSFRPNVPSTVYTRISTYPNWILQTICANSLYPPTSDMCSGIIPLARIPIAPSSSSSLSPTSAPMVDIDGAACQQNGTATTNACNYLIFFQNRGTYVHRSLLGVCIQKCTIFRNLYLRTGWDCGQC